jgi:elongation factor P
MSILNVENIHPGKGTPVTQLNMRRIGDGVKVSERYRTTEPSSAPIVEEREHTFLYQDGEGYHFMNPESYDQLVATEEVIGDLGAYLQENMTVVLSTHNDIPIALELPRTVTLEIVETEPSVKGQTASSSYKPAILSNGVRTMVPPYIAVGTRVIILTEDGSYPGTRQGLGFDHCPSPLAGEGVGASRRMRGRTGESRAAPFAFSV